MELLQSCAKPLLWLCFVLLRLCHSPYWINFIYLPIFFRVASLLRGQLYDCPGAVANKPVKHTCTKTQQSGNLHNYRDIRLFHILRMMCKCNSPTHQEVAPWEATVPSFWWGMTGRHCCVKAWLLWWYPWTSGWALQREISRKIL